uniref:Uncharacterized protein n=1 Tax=Cyanoderma ruficeps TaxID=181631 RepID=A0A8C3XE95_9PASS
VLLAQDAGHAAVAGQDGHEGQQEAGEGEGDAVGEALGDDDEPHGRAHQPRQLLALLLVPRGQGVADAQVALDADAGEEEDAAVQVGVELEAHELAGEVPERPIVLLGVVVDEEGQGADVEQVGHGQVEHVDRAAAQRLPRQPDLPDDHGVQGQPHHEHHRVHQGQQHLLELLVVGARVPPGAHGCQVGHGGIPSRQCPLCWCGPSAAPVNVRGDSW